MRKKTSKRKNKRKIMLLEIKKFRQESDFLVRNYKKEKEEFNKKYRLLFIDEINR